MSDHLSPYQEQKFRSSVSFGQQSPVLKREFLSTKIALTLDIKYSFLRELHKAKCDYPDMSFISILNSQISPVYLRESQRLENRLSRLSSAIPTLFKKQNGGRQKETLNGKVKKIAVYDTEIENAEQLQKTVSRFKKENLILTEKCRVMLHKLTETNKQRKEAQKQLESNQSELSVLRTEKDTLMECLGIQSDEPKEHKGKAMDEVSKSQKYKLIGTLKTQIEKALWFADSYGLHPKTVKLENSEGEIMNLDFNKNNVDDMDKMMEILFILDKFRISDSAYHEIVRKTDDLPKLHSIVSLRDKTNSTFEIFRTPGNTAGAYVSLRSELETIIKDQKIPPEEALQIKISGDGTKITRISNYIVLSFSVLSSGKLSADEQKVLAIVKCTENYENLHSCLSPVFREINDLYSNKQIEIDGRTHKLDIFFGGDMKFIQLCLGLGSSTGEFACPWCKVSKTERGDISKEWNFYHSDENVRCIEEIRKFARSSEKQKYGVKHDPLIDVEPKHIIPDELHLFMRIFDILLRNLIDDVKDKDDNAKTNKAKADYMDSLVKQINDCGVSFCIWTSKGRNDFEWTSLTGNDMKKVMRLLPDRMMFVIHNDTHDATVELWKIFWKLYVFICSNEVERKSAHQIFLEAKHFIELFLKLNLTERKGYSAKNVTPYMHCLVYHVPYFISEYGSLRRFSGQPTEKVNDNIKAVHHMKTNHHDSAFDAMKVQKRIESNAKFDRSKRNYNKIDDDFWTFEKRELHVRKKRHILQEIQKANAVNTIIDSDFPEYDKMTDSELKQKLKSLGIVTKIRKRIKLVELLKQTYETSNKS